KVHDTLFVAEPTTGVIDMYDCYSAQPNNLATSTRYLTATLDTNAYSPIAVDATNGILFASDGTNIQIWNNPATVNSTTAPAYTMSSATGSLLGVTVDAVNRKLYALDGGNPNLQRFAYTSAADLNGSPSNDAFLQFGGTTGVYGIEALSMDSSTGNLWW